LSLVTSADSTRPPFDAKGNLIAHHGALDTHSAVDFAGRHNRLVAEGSVALDRISATFLGDDAQLVIGAVGPGEHLSLDVTLGANASVTIGAGVTSEKTLVIVAEAGATVRIGAGSHFGPHVDIMASDALGLGTSDGPDRHDVSIGEHVWVMRGAELRAGTDIGDGAVLEMTPLVDHELPAGQLVRGLPATPVRPVTWDRSSLPGAQTRLARS